MRKQATQIIPGDSVRVADINLVEGIPGEGPKYRKVLRVKRQALTVQVTMTEDHWGIVAATAAVRVHRSSNRAANVITQDKE